MVWLFENSQAIQWEYQSIEMHGHSQKVETKELLKKNIDRVNTEEFNCLGEQSRSGGVNILRRVSFQLVEIFKRS